MKCGTCGHEDPRATFWVGTTRRGEIYTCPTCGKTGTKEEVTGE